MKYFSQNKLLFLGEVEKKELNMRGFGLIGKTLTHSFSKQYFTKKFHHLSISANYELFELAEINVFPDLLQQKPNLKGLNVTIPYKSAIIPFLDELSEAAQQIGAVNTVQFSGKKLIGHNTDIIGFRDALQEIVMEKKLRKALVLGTGGASKAAVYALKAFFDCEAQLVSRTAKSQVITYDTLREFDWHAYEVVVNTTPLGTFPNIHQCPDLPYERFHRDQVAFDMVYNPVETLFMQKALAAGATVSNGMKMLIGQAEAAWEIWNEDRLALP